MRENKTPLYQSDTSSQSWLNVSAYVTLAVLGIIGWYRKDLVHRWLAGGTVPLKPPAPLGEPAAPLPDILPFPLALPTAEQVAAWRAVAVHWAPLVAVWLLTGIAVLGSMWLTITLMLRIAIRRPRSCGRFTFSHAQELASQTLLAMIAAALLATGFLLPVEYWSGVLPLGVFVAFCTAVPGEKGWFTWGKLAREWRGVAQYYRVPDYYSIPYEPPPASAPANEPLSGQRASPQLMRLRKKLEKIDAQVMHKSTHPNQRAAARHARDILQKKIDALETGNDG